MSELKGGVKNAPDTVQSQEGTTVQTTTPAVGTQKDHHHHHHHHQPKFTKRFAALLSVVLLNEAMAATMILPFVGLLVAHFGDGDRNRSGYTSGFLIGIFQLAQIYFAPFWGRHSDVLGRRAIIIWGLCCSSVLILAFGFCETLWTAMAVRFLLGCFAATVSIAKSATVEVTDAKTEARGFAILTGTWSVGAMIGPAMGGALYDPCGNSLLKFMALTPESIFCQRPALFPCVISSCYALTAATAAYFFFPETNPRAAPEQWKSYLLSQLPSCLRCGKKRHAPPTGDVDGDGDEENVQLRETGTERQDGDEADGKPKGKSDDDRRIEEDEFRDLSSTNSENSISNSRCTSPNLAVEQENGEEHGNCQNGNAPDHTVHKVPLRYFTAKECWNNKLIRCLFVNYMCICAPNIAFVECLPLWAISARERGGLGLEAGDLGIFFSINGILGLLSNTTFEKQTKIFGRLPMWRGSMVLWGIALLSFPCVGFVRASLSDAAILAVLCCVTALRCLAGNNGFSLSMMFIGNAAPEGHKGSVMGYAQSVAAISRTIAPALASPIFAWSIATHRPFPFNYFFAFILSALFFVWPFFSSFALTEADITKKPLPGTGSEAEKENHKSSEDDKGDSQLSGKSKAHDDESDDNDDEGVGFVSSVMPLAVTADDDFDEDSALVPLDDED